MTEYGRAALREGVDLVVSQGADNSWALVYRVVEGDTETRPDLTAGYEARAQFRARTGGDVWVSLTHDVVDGTGIELATEGVIRILLDHTVTEDPAWNTRKAGVWDLELVKPGGEVVRLAMGAVRVSPDVTRGVS